MGIWDKIKAFFTEEPAQQPQATQQQRQQTQQQAAASQSSPQRPPGTPATAAQAQAPAEPQKKAANPYQANEILGLSAEEMRKRALKINPMRTAWIGRTDTIPPQSDERTALIDRGLILRGYLKPEQLVEIHRVGDLWLKFHEAERLASTAAQKKTADIVEELKRQKIEKKKQKKLAAERRKKEHAEAVQRRKETDIIYLGRGVSAELFDRRSHIERLMERKLPLLSTPGEVARSLGLTISKLRWLCFHSEAAEKTHYAAFSVPKRSGGRRLIAAPMPELAAAQRWILREILDKVSVEAPAHGFLKTRSTLTNAVPHLGKDVIINVDLADFFPSIGFKRVRGVFKKLGYSPAASTILALIATESPRVPVEHDGVKYQVAIGERALPQGAPTSPALSNLIARKLDRRLLGVSKKFGWTYTRYADDLTFSAPEGHREEIARFLAKIRHICEDEGFRINLKKGRVQRKARRQLVTGVVVNQKPGLPREEIRKIRAILHQAKKTGLEAQNKEKRPNFEAHLRGKIAYLMMVDRAKGKKFMTELDAVVKTATASV